jgi:hypothetical protein
MSHTLPTEVSEKLPEDCITIYRYMKPKDLASKILDHVRSGKVVVVAPDKRAMRQYFNFPFFAARMSSLVEEVVDLEFLIEPSLYDNGVHVAAFERQQGKVKGE